MGFFRLTLKVIITVDTLLVQSPTGKVQKAYTCGCHPSDMEGSVAHPPTEVIHQKDSNARWGGGTTQLRWDRWSLRWYGGWKRQREGQRWYKEIVRRKWLIYVVRDPRSVNVSPGRFKEFYSSGGFLDPPSLPCVKFPKHDGPQVSQRDTIKSFTREGCSSLKRVSVVFNERNGSDFQAWKAIRLLIWPPHIWKSVHAQLWCWRPYILLFRPPAHPHTHGSCPELWPPSWFDAL